jgi:hypothetical protein
VFGGAEGAEKCHFCVLTPEYSAADVFAHAVRTIMPTYSFFTGGGFPTANIIYAWRNTAYRTFADILEYDVYFVRRIGTLQQSKKRFR